MGPNFVTSLRESREDLQKSYHSGEISGFILSDKERFVKYKNVPCGTISNVMANAHTA